MTFTGYSRSPGWSIGEPSVNLRTNLRTNVSLSLVMYVFVMNWV